MKVHTLPWENTSLSLAQGPTDPELEVSKKEMRPTALKFLAGNVQRTKKVINQCILD